MQGYLGMTKNQPPIFGENGTILNADKMQPQKEWPKPEPQRMTRKQIKSLTLAMLIVVGITLGNLLWQLIGT